MSCVPLLPQELGCAQEQACAHFPAEDVAPLVDQQGQVAVRLYPVAEGVPDDGFARGANDELFFKLCFGVHNHTLALGIGFQAIVCNHCTFLGKALHVVGLFAQKRLGNEKREIGILHASLFKHVVKPALHFFPYGISIWLDDHAASYGRLLGQVGFHNQFVVPLRVVVGSLCEIF